MNVIVAEELALSRTDGDRVYVWDADVGTEEEWWQAQALRRASSQPSRPLVFPQHLPQASAGKLLSPT